MCVGVRGGAVRFATVSVTSLLSQANAISAWFKARPITGTRSVLATTTRS
jgi:hypothetical protein